MLKNKIITLSLFLFFIFSTTFAQEKNLAVPLKLILDNISSEYEIKFNYIENQIAIYSFIPPQKKWSLESKINYIQKETGLQIKVLDNKYYTIISYKQYKKFCGYLIDSENGLPIEDANITITNTNITTVSDSTGYFEFSAFSPNQIKIKHINFVYKELSTATLNNTICSKIKLDPYIQKLDKVVTEHYLTTGISKNIDGTIVFKPRKYGILPGLVEPEILQTMQQVPGISSENETISNINVRGGTHDQNLFLWNGVRIFQTGHFFGLISSFNPLLSNTISITKNGTSAFFGESVSSLANISSHSKSNNNNHTRISSNLISIAFYTKFQVSKNGNLKFSGRRSFSDFYSSPTYENYRDRILQNTVVTNLISNKKIDFKSIEKFYFYDVTVHYQQKIGIKNEINFNAIAIKNNLTIKQSYIGNNKKSDLNQYNFGGTIDWRTNWNATNSTEIYCSSSHYNLDSTNQFLQNDQVHFQQNSVFNFDIQLKNLHQISKNLLFNSGYQYNQIVFSNIDKINIPLYSRISKEVSPSHALIAEGEYTSNNKKAYIKAGVRFNYFTKFNKSIIEPRVQFSYSLSDLLSLEILGEQKNQTISQLIDLQNDFLGIEKKRWTLSNDKNIPIQKSNQFSIGFTYKDKSWLITLENFYKKISGITGNGQGFQNQLEFNKLIGDYEVFGTEFLIQKSLNHFYTWLSYSFNDNEYHFDTLSPSKFPNNYEFTHSLSWAGVYEWSNFKVALGSKWRTGNPTTSTQNNTLNYENPINPKINYNQPNNTRLANYFQFNVSASKEWNLSKKTTLQTSFSVQNLFNNKNIINRFYRINPQNNSIESVETYSLERTPNFNIKISF